MQQTSLEKVYTRKHSYLINSWKCNLYQGGGKVMEWNSRIFPSIITSFRVLLTWNTKGGLIQCFWKHDNVQFLFYRAFHTTAFQMVSKGVSVGLTNSRQCSTVWSLKNSQQWFWANRSYSIWIDRWPKRKYKSFNDIKKIAVIIS